MPFKRYLILSAGMLIGTTDSAFEAAFMDAQGFEIIDLYPRFPHMLILAESPQEAIAN